MWEVIFDLETKKFFDDTGTNDPADLGVSVLSLYHRQFDSQGKEISGQLMSFWEPDFDRMWKLFQEADRIIGFNSLNFDVPALKPYAPAGFAKLPHFDILDKIKEIQGRRVSLNSVASQTLGNTKTDHGSNAIKYWNEHTPESLAKLQSYCEADVTITRDVYDFGFKNKFLKYIDHWNNLRTVAVDFSYPAVSSSVQSSLF
jgi:DEAD/DEAH box helicase domain-containing protein